MISFPAKPRGGTEMKGPTKIEEKTREPRVLRSLRLRACKKDT
jgi:hypothetical protein